MYYIGLDVHKRKISYCVKDSSGKFRRRIASRTRLIWTVDENAAQPWSAAMEATMFTGWIYDHLSACSALKVAHPLMLRAIAAAKKKNDRLDASKIATACGAIFLPECYMARPRFANVDARCGTATTRRQMVQMKNKITDC